MYILQSIFIVILFNTFTSLKYEGFVVNMAVDLRSYQLQWTNRFQRITLCFRGQQAEHEDDMFYEEDEIFGEEHEGWPCLEW